MKLLNESGYPTTVRFAEAMPNLMGIAIPKVAPKLVVGLILTSEEMGQVWDHIGDAAQAVVNRRLVAMNITGDDILHGTFDRNNNQTQLIVKTTFKTKEMADTWVASWVDSLE